MTHPTFRALLDEVADMAEHHVSPYLSHEKAWGEFLDRIDAALAAEPQEGVPSDEAIMTAVLSQFCPSSTPLMQSPSDNELDLVTIAIQALAPHQPDAATHNLQAIDRGREILRDLLARHTPTPGPVAVGDRLPGPGDCAPWPDDPDATHWCWAAKEIDGGWKWVQLSMLDIGSDALGRIIAGGGWTHWLPATALPLPEVQP